MAGGIVKYHASDGQEVTLSPTIVAKYIITGNAKADDKDVFAFIAKCQARGLNPLAGDAYMTVFNGKQGPVASVVVSKDYFVRTATRQESFDGFRAGVVVATKDGLIYREGCIVGDTTEKLVGGWAEVSVRGRSVPSRSEVSLTEYDQHRGLWTSKPATMIRKVALVQALREAYPGAYGGIYDRDEMPEADSPIPTESQAVEHADPQPAQEPAETPQAPDEPVEPDTYDEDQEF